MAVSTGRRLWANWYAGKTPGEDHNYVALRTSGDNDATWREVLVVDPDGSYALSELPAALNGAQFLRTKLDGQKELRCSRAGTACFLTPAPNRNRQPQPRPPDADAGRSGIQESRLGAWLTACSGSPVLDILYLPTKLANLPAASEGRQFDGPATMTSMSCSSKR